MEWERNDVNNKLSLSKMALLYVYKAALLKNWEHESKVMGQ